MNDAPVLRSLKGDRAFGRLRKGRSGGAKHLSVRLRPTGYGEVRLAVVVSRKVGNAVVRNRVRRRLREAMLALVRHRAAGTDAGTAEPDAAAPRRAAWPTSFDLLVLTRPSAAEADYHELARSLEKAVERALTTSERGGGRERGSGREPRGRERGAGRAAVA